MQPPFGPSKSLSSTNGEGKVETGVLLEEFGHAFDFFSNAVADNKQKEPSKPQIARDGVVERRFVDFGLCRHCLVEASCFSPIGAVGRLIASCSFA